MTVPSAETGPSAETDECLFCRIATGVMGVPFLAEGDGVVAFRDLHPRAPTHVLVVPVAHHRDVGALARHDPQALGALVRLGSRIADAEAGGEFRLVFNTGAGVGQSVFHVHGHVLAGRSFGWPPG